jgi:hypothetical protein
MKDEKKQENSLIKEISKELEEAAGHSLNGQPLF